jgi:hypothetical protein
MFFDAATFHMSGMPNRSILSKDACFQYLSDAHPNALQISKPVLLGLGMPDYKLMQNTDE